MCAQYSSALSQDKAPWTKAFPRLSQMWKVCRFIVLKDHIYTGTLLFIFLYQSKRLFAFLASGWHQVLHVFNLNGWLYVVNVIVQIFLTSEFFYIAKPKLCLVTYEKEHYHYQYCSFQIGIIKQISGDEEKVKNINFTYHFNRSFL